MHSCSHSSHSDNRSFQQLSCMCGARRKDTDFMRLLHFLNEWYRRKVHVSLRVFAADSIKIGGDPAPLRAGDGRDGRRGVHGAQPHRHEIERGLRRTHAHRRRGQDSQRHPRPSRTASCQTRTPSDPDHRVISKSKCSIQVGILSPRATCAGDIKELGYDIE